MLEWENYSRRAKTDIVMIQIIMPERINGFLPNFPMTCPQKIVTNTWVKNMTIVYNVALESPSNI